jgi:hypothetical protein
LNKNGFPYKSDGETNYSASRTITLSAYPFAMVNINDSKDFIEKFKKIISDFIISYKIIVLKENKFEMPKKMSNGGKTENKVDLFFGGLGNGTSVFDRNREENNQYKFIAHISDQGKISYIDKNLPESAKKKIENWTKRNKIKYEDGGVIGQEIVFDDNGEENTGVIKDIHEITGNYVVLTDDGRTVLADKEIDVISLGSMRKAPEKSKRFGFFKDGGTTSSESVLWGVKVGDPDWKEVLITNNPDRIDAARQWALANGYDRLRVASIDMSTRPEFTKTFKDGGNIENDKFPDKYIANYDLVWLKTKEDSKGANYNVYYRGYDISSGGFRFGTPKQFKQKADNEFILSIEWYNKLRYKEEQPLPDFSKNFKDGGVMNYDWASMWKKPSKSNTVMIGDIVFQKHSDQPYRIVELLDDEYTVAKILNNQEIEWKTFNKDFYEHRMFEKRK